MTSSEAGRHITSTLTLLYTASEAAAISDLVMEHLTGSKRTSRSATNTVLTGEQQMVLQQYLERLVQHEPVQYVLNEAWFCGMKFYVDNRVLIPRPETEELVEWIISGCRFPIDQLSILDIGAGSGCIGIALKKRLGKAQVWGVDASREALEVAGKNAKALGTHVDFLEMDFLNPAERSRLPAFDIVVSNPPYIPEKEKSFMDPNVVRFEPSGALFVPDNNALVFYEALAEFGKEHLNRHGLIYAEISESLGNEVMALFSRYGYKTEMKKDMQGKDRMIRVSAKP